MAMWKTVHICIPNSVYINIHANNKRIYIQFWYYIKFTFIKDKKPKKIYVYVIYRIGGKGTGKLLWEKVKGKSNEKVTMGNCFDFILCKKYRFVLLFRNAL